MGILAKIWFICFSSNRNDDKQTQFSNNLQNHLELITFILITFSVFFFIDVCKKEKNKITEKNFLQIQKKKKINESCFS